MSGMPPMHWPTRSPTRSSVSSFLPTMTLGPPPPARRVTARPPRWSSGMIRPIPSWRSFTTRPGVFRTSSCSSWLSSSPSHPPTPVGGILSSSPSAATPLTTTSSSMPWSRSRPPRDYALTTSCSPRSLGQSPSTSMTSFATLLMLARPGWRSRASFWAMPKPGIYVSMRASAPSSRVTSPLASSTAG
jgi:hypothetical protein